MWTLSGLPLAHVTRADNGVQFWGIARCFALVEAHEERRRRWLEAVRSQTRHAPEDGAAPSAHLYRWVLRARPDMTFTAQHKGVIRSIVHAHSSTAHLKARVWLRRAHASDVLALVTRAAAPGYFSVWQELLGGCATLEPRSAEDRRDVCRRTVLLSADEYGTECLIALHLRRHAVNISLADGLKPTLLRPPVANATYSGVKKTREYFVCPSVSGARARAPPGVATAPA